MSQSPSILFDPQRRRSAQRSKRRRRAKNKLFLWMCMAVAFFSVLILAALLGALTWQGAAALDWNFITSPPNPDPEKAGIWPALWGTVWLCVVCAIVTLPLGAATAIFLEEFQPKNRWLKRVHGFIQLNISNLAGVPSVVYGIIGLTVFVSMFGLSAEDPVFEFGVTYYDQYVTAGRRVVLIPAEGPDAPPAQLEDGMRVTFANGETVRINVIAPDASLPEDPQLLDRTLRAGAGWSRIHERAWYYVRIPFGRGVLAGALTLMLVVLPIVIVASQEALRAVPDSLREGALGMGATQWQVVRRVTLPASIPGIMTGSIIAMSRAIGEAAPLLMIAGVVFITTAPDNLMSSFTAMPLQIFNWAGRPQQPFHEVAAAGIIVLLLVLLVFNSIAVFIRHKLQKPLS